MKGIWESIGGKKREYNIEKALDEIEAIVGSNAVIKDRDLLREKSVDFTPIFYYKKVKGYEVPTAEALITPRDAKELSNIVKVANKYGIPIIPLGGGSGVVGGLIPISGGILVSMENFKEIKIDEENMVVVAGAGVTGRSLEEVLNKKGYTVGHYPQSLNESTVGGWIATKSIGQYSTKYGGIEDMVLGVEVVMPNGEIIKTKASPRSSNGPSMKDLFIGSEGTLGLITSASLKMRVLPEHRQMLSYSFKGFNEAIKAAKKMMLQGLNPDVVRVYDKDDAFLWFEGDANEPLMIVILEEHREEMLNLKARLVDEIVKEFGGSYVGEKYASLWLKDRFEAKKKAEDYMQMGFLLDTIEVSSFWSSLYDVYSSIKNGLLSIKDSVVLNASAHADHFSLNGACLYFTVGGAPEKGPEAFYEAIWSKAMEACLSFECSISDHHGIGILRRPWIREELGSSYALLKKLKEALDNRDIMNPGKLV
ncbi:MAG: FAD-binding oxidoreductase [Caldisphaeraceae archaeon]|nr:FAD-binding oxidoreductase [Caldisphaeraceae archaeon]